MSKNVKEKVVFLPRVDPDLVRSSSDWSETDAYWVIDRRPKVGEYYINLSVAEKERSIQKHDTLKALRNHQRDYRFRHCFTVVRTTNIKYSPIESQQKKSINNDTGKASR